MGEKTDEAFSERASQTRIKHEILREYAGAWAGIIGNGLLGHHRRGRSVELSLVYVDGFAGNGRYERDADQREAIGPIWGSPVIGTQALETVAERLRGEGLPVRVSAVLVEEKEDWYEALLENWARAGLRTPLWPANRVSDASQGHVVAIRGDFREHVADVVEWLGDSFALVLIDPFGPAMPLSSLVAIAGRQRTDTINHFPALDIGRKAGSICKPVADRTANDRGNITRITDHFGTDDWATIALSSSGTDRAQQYLELYTRQLRSIDRDLVVKSIPLRLSEADRTAYHLFLMTRDPDGALRMNDILRGAGLRQYSAVWADYIARQRQRDEQQAQLGFGFDVPFAPPPTVESPTADTAEVARDLVAACPARGEHRLKDVYRWMADTPYTAGEVNSALRALKADDRVSFDGRLKSKDERIRFY